MKTLNEAYEVLRNPQKRAAYYRELAQQRQAEENQQQAEAQRRREEQRQQELPSSGGIDVLLLATLVGIASLTGAGLFL